MAFPGPDPASGYAHDEGPSNVLMERNGRIFRLKDPSITGQRENSKGGVTYLFDKSDANLEDITESADATAIELRNLYYARSTSSILGDWFHEHPNDWVLFKSIVQFGGLKDTYDKIRKSQAEGKSRGDILADHFKDPWTWVAILSSGKGNNAKEIVKAAEKRGGDVAKAVKEAETLLDTIKKGVKGGTKLTSEESDKLRTQARNIWQDVSGRRAVWDKLDVHHRIPLEWSHLMPGDPNRLSNLVGVKGPAHDLISADWAAFKAGLGGKTPTASQIMEKALEIDKKYAKDYVFPK